MLHAAYLTGHGSGAVQARWVPPPTGRSTVRVPPTATAVLSSAGAY
ncbi:MAG TPA: hypothetical protein VFC16_14355 [Nakamurella sp.]|nr:hypothetical protein [Nakamurella sp.]